VLAVAASAEASEAMWVMAEEILKEKGVTYP